MTRLFVFDCDGTLVDSRAWIVHTMQAAFGEVGLEPPGPDAIARIVGRSLPQAIADLYPEGGPSGRSAVLDAYRRVARATREAGTIPEPLFPGAREVLEELDRRERLLGIATGKNRWGLRHVLDTHGLGHLFVTLQTADHNPSKPHPSMVEHAMAETGSDPHETLIIGDTTHDVLMARNAGARAFGVAWGNHPSAELLDAGAERVLNRFEELLDYVEW